MARFILTIEASVDLTAGTAPTLDIFVEGSYVTSSSAITAQTGVGSNILVFTLDFDDATYDYPSALSFQFNGTSGDGDETVTIESVRINGQAINTGSDLTSAMLTQGQTASLSSPSSLDYLFGRADPTLGDFGSATQTGTGSGEEIEGTEGADIIDGGGGNDRLLGMDDDDALNGSSGDDNLYGQEGNDVLLGGTGDDVLYGHAGDDMLHGQDDDDRLFGGTGNDLLNGGAGNDVLMAGTGDDILYGESGDDRLIGQTGSNSMYGDAGDDILIGGNQNDFMNGGDDNDTIYGGSGDDIINGGDGNDTGRGSNGADTINGGGGDDSLYGDAGNDTISGGDGNDVIDGGNNDDTIYGDGSSITNVMEAGRTTVTQTNGTQWHSVSFTGVIQSAVIKMFAEDVTGDPFTMRVRNITTAGFEFQLDEYDYQDGSTAAETISWIAVASGSHTLTNGIHIEAGFTTATNESTAGVSFTSSFTTPVIFSQVSSDNELSAVATRNSNLTGTGFSVQMQEEEANPNSHATEDIGWIAMESGGSVATGMLVGTTGDTVTDSTSTVNFGGTFGTTPIFLADMQTTDGGDAGVTSGSTLSTTQAQLYVDEETSNDTETNHTTENVGYVALENGLYTGTSVITGNDTLFGSDGDDIIYADDTVDTFLLAPSSTNLLATLIMADSPDAYWDLNETSGTTTDNQGSIGAAVDGTVIGGATLNAGALYTNGGTSIDFDGSNDGISIPDDAGINTSTYAERTVELVFNADDVTTRQVLYEEGAGTNGLTIYLDGGNVYVTGEDDGDWVDADIHAAVSTGTTYHVAFVFDQPNNSFTGYLDGVSMGSVTVNNAIFPGHSGDIGIGYAPDTVQWHDGESSGGGYYFDGRISDVALYNTALSATDILSRSNAIHDTPISANPINNDLYGGDGFDQLFGGNGSRDIFHFEDPSAYNDIDEINGFDIGEQDAIDISDLLSGYVDGVSDINDFVTATTSGSDTIIAVDASGSGSSYTDVAQINGLTGVDADFLLNNNSLIPV